MKRKRIELLSERSDRCSVKRPEHFKKPLRRPQRVIGRGLEPAELLRNRLAPGVEIEHRAAEIDAFDLRQLEIIQRRLFLGRPEPQASTGRGAARPTGALGGRGLADPLQFQPIKSSARIERWDSSQSAVDNPPDAVDCQRGFSDVG